MSKLAIAYSMKRKQRKASGGTVSSGDKTMNMAKGGDVDPMAEACPHCGSKKMSEGGKVANSDLPVADFKPNEFDDLHLRDDLEEHETGANSGDELGGPSKDDLVARAMLRKKKR